MCLTESGPDHPAHGRAYHLVQLDISLFTPEQRGRVLPHRQYIFLTQISQPWPWRW